MCLSPLFVVAMFIGCGTSVPIGPDVYRYKIQNDFIPDSNKVKIAKWITETMSATSNRMTTSDYEDPEDVIKQLEQTGKELFSVRIEGLEVLDKRTADKQFPTYIFIQKSELDATQLKEFEKLKK